MQAPATAQPAFGAPAVPKTAGPGPHGIPVKPFARPRGVRIPRRGDMAVMHQPVRRGVMAKEQRHIDRHPEAACQPPRLVDQLMRRRMRHLPKPQPRREKQRDPAAHAQRIARHSPDHQRQQQKMTKTDQQKQRPGQWKLHPFARITGNPWQHPVDQHRQHRHHQQRQPRPEAPLQRRRPDQQGRAERHQRKHRHRQRKWQDRRRGGLHRFSLARGVGATKRARRCRDVAALPLWPQSH